MTTDWLAAHRERLDGALGAIRSRGYYSAFPESPSPRVYGETAAEDGKAAFEAHRGTTYALETPGATGTVSSEESPYGVPLDVQYPRATESGLDELMEAARKGLTDWRKGGIDARTGVTLEILDRLHKRVFELANAVQHTSGQAFVMAFQAGGAHALDRALEAIAYSYEEMSRYPATAIWEKPAKGDPIRLEKNFTVTGRGVALVIGCNTFPTWNSWPGLFASLVTGNAVVVKPHPLAVLPLAITVEVAREVLAEAGYDPNLVTLAAEHPGDGLAKPLALRPEVKVIDFTGGTEFGDWLEQNATQAEVFTEKAGVNAVIIDSTDSFKALCNNLAFTLSLYSGQMCTTTQNLFVPADGIETDEGHKSFDEVGAGLANSISKLLGDDARAVELLGGIVNRAVVNRLDLAPEYGDVVLESRAITHPAYENAVVRTPLLVAIDAKSEDVYGKECFGPVSFLVRTSGTAESIELFRRTVEEGGAMTAGVYSTDAAVLEEVRDAALDVGVALSENLTGQVFVNQSAAFSDFHGTGANPAANATYTDGAYVASRFRVIQSRRHA
ncbi:phenylacetic acid degradation protein PaaN [Streptomyces sp. SID13031]|uniref:phenylacetic acid degradation protein PaaN n=1 Tax=Streptomyces sp. SID13031 TaxID=2706046 RepID=UPI0013C61079|nr:phenylacetic acid degradation protein PaaN [Streptomyces sp. SID13031]NEA36119.1 phenylacetic acid degradation protein PaaN [Streptomyces sp. SID13031]